MKRGQGSLIRRDLGRLFEGQSVAGLGEEQLLARFVERRDEPAFAALVARHGPMVLGVCRRLLADPLDVEDAFQATFLIFIRRAGSIRGRDRLAPWLFGVARKVASRSRTDLARRKAREISGVEAIATVADGLDRELNQALLEEIDRLPASLRQPILLCCVEGLSYEEAAGRMKSTSPAVRGRLARARERLRVRLSRRGFAPSVVGATGMLAEGAARAAVPARLLLMTTQLSKAGAFPASVGILAEGVIGTMIATKSKVLALALLACGVAGTGVGVYAQRPGPADASGPLPSAMSPPATDAEEGNPLPAAEPQKPEADRLGQLEQKLDRILNALEGNSGFRPTPLNPITRANPAHRTVDPETGRPVGSARTATPPARKMPSDPDAKPVPPQPGVVRYERVPMTGKTASPSDDRLDALEQKLGRLEARINNLERRLNQPPESPMESPPSVDDRRTKRRFGGPADLDSTAPQPPPTPQPPTAPK